ncbi:unnamed protein product [Withania somnifera]
MANYRMDSEEEALFRNSPYPLYFVQSPSTISHANSGELSRHNNSNNNNNNKNEFSSIYRSPMPGSKPVLWLSRIRLKKISCDSLQSHGTGTDHENIEIDQEKRCGTMLLVHHGKNSRNIHDEDEDEDEDEDYYYYEKGNWKRFFSLGYSDSTPWIVLQVTWRLIVSMIVALVVFYIATKPPAPKVSLEGEELYARSYGPTYFKLNVGTRDKALYGAGRLMQDMLQSSKGLPLLIRVHLYSTFHVVWGLIKPKFHHQIECIVVLHNKYNKKHRTQAYNSTCLLIPS